MKTVSVVIPAHNEEKTITQVVKVCRECKYINEIIVVDDGSIDKTSLLSQEAGAKVIREDVNRGKAYALYQGSLEAKGEYLLFLDADLIGLNTSHIEDLIEPVLYGKADTTLGIFTGGRFCTDLAHALTPFLSGQRCIRKEVFLSSIESFENLRYGIEIILSKYFAKNDMKVLKIPLDSVTHVMKEEKTGKGKGGIERIKMYFDIFLAIFKR